MDIGKAIAIDIPGNQCFGCAPDNAYGLRLVFTRTAEHTVTTQFVAASHHCGAEGIVHGGLQAVLLDEVMGVAIRTRHPQGERPNAVTAEFNLRYRGPVPTGVPITVEGASEFVVNGTAEDDLIQFTPGNDTDEIVVRLPIGSGHPRTHRPCTRSDPSHARTCRAAPAHVGS